MPFQLPVIISTEILVLILGHLFSGLLGIAYRAKSKNDPVINAFLLARLFDVLAWVFTGIRDAVPDMLSLLLGNTFFLFGSAFQIKALLLMKERFTGFSSLVLLASTMVLIFVINATPLAGLSANLQTAVLSLALAAQWIYPSAMLLFEKNSSTLQKFIAVVYVLGLVPHLINAYFGLTDPSEETLPLHTSTVFPFFTTVYITMLVGNMGVILMSKERADSTMAHAASYDELTGIYNRRTFLALTQQALDHHARSGRPLSYMIMDLDLFKDVNDAHGHFVGDLVLKSFANTVRGQLRFRDVLGRFGGEEFTLMLLDTDEKGGLIVAERIRQAAEEDYVSGLVHYTVSIGLVTTVPGEHTTIDMLYKASDKALYLAKSNGRNRVEIGPVIHS